MATKAPARKGRPGRPPAGVNGERSSDYRAMSLRLPAAARQRLAALRIAAQRPAWAIVADALDVYAAHLAAERPELRAVLAVARPARRRARA